MIGYLRGILLNKETPNVILDVNGVGYEIQIPVNAFFRLPENGKEISLYIHFVSREDGQFLYGFLEKEQQSMFRSLIRVNGVGPKMALAILSSMEPDIFVRCVLHDDIDMLTRIPGVGEKTAKRLIVEMRDKVETWETVGVATDDKFGVAIRDAMSALIALGYKPHEAHEMRS